MNNMINIYDLKEKEIFVFGSNLNGYHDGGAAKLAYEKFRAEYYFSVGPTGQCYAIPTLDENMRQIPLQDIKKYLDSFVEYAKEMPNNIFLLTPIGTGIAGYKIEDLESILPELPDNIIPTWK